MSRTESYADKTFIVADPDTSDFFHGGFAPLS
jgi:hypothetical protein